LIKDKETPIFQGDKKITRKSEVQWIVPYVHFYLNSQQLNSFISNKKQAHMIEGDDFDFDEPQVPQEPFHLELDLYDTGDYYNLLIIPCNEEFIVVSNNEHFTTMVHNGTGIDAWEQRDGQLEDEVFEKLAIALNQYIYNQ